MSRTRKPDRIRPLERALHRAGEADRRLRQAAAEELGIGITDLDTLLLLDEYGALAAGRIAEALAITTGAVTELVDRLERAGWVARTRHEADRRQVLVGLASARRATIDAHRALRERLLDEALSGTDDNALSSSVTLIEAAAQRLIAGAGEISERVSHEGADDDGASQEGERAPIGSAARGRLRFVAGVPRLELRGARIRDARLRQRHRPLVNRADRWRERSFCHRGMSCGRALPPAGVIARGSRTRELAPAVSRRGRRS